MPNEDLINSSIRWKNRRRMAWACTIGAMVFPFILLGVPSGSDLAAISFHFYTFCGGVVMSYIGFATWDDKKHESDTNQSNQSRD